MSTQKQVQASRVNGGMSRGPVTAEGKRVAARNAVKHGIFCRQVVLDCEDREVFEEFASGMADYWQPAGPMESLLFDRVVAEAWRLQRVARIEREIMEGDFAEMQAFLDARDEEIIDDEERPPRQASLGPAVTADFRQDTLDRLRRYEGRIERSMYKAIAELRQLQAPRVAEEQRRMTATRARVEGIAAAMKQLLQNIADRAEYLEELDAGLEDAQTPSPQEDADETQRRQEWIANAQRQRQDEDHTINRFRRQYERLERRLAEQRAILAADEAGTPWPMPPGAECLRQAVSEAAQFVAAAGERQ
jgi:hypothetical protein